MATLSLSCLSKLEPGAIRSDSGHVTTATTEEPFPLGYDPERVSYSLDFEQFWNSMYQGSLV